MPSTTSRAASLKLSRSLISLPSDFSSTASKTVVSLPFSDDVPVAPFDAETLAPPEAPLPPPFSALSLVFALPTTATFPSSLKSGNPIPHPAGRKAAAQRRRVGNKGM
ncbi:Uncharacterised protein [Neisseria gonorrhoeae]|uniref:Uncharacterized protein n=1 Tax=Neisseria gonorrhoeae TaxID=485 RepID=A0A378VTM2_NEIGO|nr:Uncharacterised protein [Neisseria gonorrhoeae]